MNKTIESTVDMLCALICANSDQDGVGSISGYKVRTGPHQVDAGSTLGLQDMHPSMAYTSIAEDREFATDSGLLLNSPQDILGKSSEVALVYEDGVRWVGVQKLSKRPRNLWVASPGCDLYAMHTRDIGQSGSDFYGVRVAAINKSGRPVVTSIQGTRDAGSNAFFNQLVLAASVIEDNHRSGTFLAKVSDSVGLAFAVPDGDHVELFKLRDGPYQGSRRKAIMHWVAGHVRKTATKDAKVREYLRGVTEFDIDGLHVRLEANQR